VPSTALPADVRAILEGIYMSGFEDWKKCQLKKFEKHRENNEIMQLLA
jgi:hypothetical protein